MKRRHSGHMGGMNNQNRRPQGRYNNGGHGGGYQQQRPRKNYAALREKFMNQARDAMSAGDRVLAEYYLQHADHYYRMQQEFLAERAARFPQQQGAPGETPEEMAEEATGPEEAEIENIPNNSNVLPAFLTRPAPAANANAENQPAAASGWEEE